MTQIDELNLDKKLRTLFYYDPDELGEDAFRPLGDDEVEEITKLIANQVREAYKDGFVKGQLDKFTVLGGE
jgi:hypothetical protein